jgi:3-mercaptopropionate dioxygenase
MTTSTLSHTTAPGLDELVAAIRSAVHEHGDWSATAERVAAAVRANLPAPTVLDGPERLHIEPDGAFSVLALPWRPGQWTGIHDHVTWCVFATLDGEPVEERFELRDGGLALAGRRACPAGTVRAEAPPGDIHRLGNPHARSALTLHVYGTDVSRIGSSLRRTYDLPRRS